MHTVKFRGGRPPHAEVWVNSAQMDAHTGGYAPFFFDVTDDALRLGSNTLNLRAIDRTNAEGAYQLHGKQREQSGGIWYAPVTGIWQTVWLEQVPGTYITEARITPAIDGEVAIELTSNARGKAPKATVTASLNGDEVATTSGDASSLVFRIPEAKLWSPDSPTLYDLTITLGDDTVRSLPASAKPRSSKALTDTSGLRSMASRSSIGAP